MIGSVDEDLEQAVRQALIADRTAAAKEASHYSWANSTENSSAALPVEAGSFADTPVRGLQMRYRRSSTLQFALKALVKR